MGEIRDGEREKRVKIEREKREREPFCKGGVEFGN